MRVLVVEASGVVGAHLDPAWAGGLFLGDGLAVMTGARGAANTKTKREVGWTLRCSKLAAGLPRRLPHPQPLTQAARPTLAASRYLHPRPAAGRSWRCCPHE
jgi:hypothetical protein